MYLEEKLMNISKVFQFLVQVYSVESSRFFLFIWEIFESTYVSNLWSPEKRLFSLQGSYLLSLLYIAEWKAAEPVLTTAKSEVFLTYYCSLPIPLELLLAHQHHQGLHFSSFQLWNPCRRWLHRLKEILQRFLLLRDANFRFFFVLLSPYTRSHIQFTCGVKGQ